MLKLRDPTARAHIHASADSYERLAKMAEHAPLIPNVPKAANEFKAAPHPVP
jgi:hypothetical protein